MSCGVPDRILRLLVELLFSSPPILINDPLWIAFAVVIVPSRLFFGWCGWWRNDDRNNVKESSFLLLVFCGICLKDFGVVQVWCSFQAEGSCSIVCVVVSMTACVSTCMEAEGKTCTTTKYATYLRAVCKMSLCNCGNREAPQVGVNIKLSLVLAHLSV